jgi:hypothetical protein
MIGGLAGPRGQLLAQPGRLQHLVTWEDTVEVLEPARLREQLAAWARKAADHHARAPGSTS